MRASISAIAASSHRLNRSMFAGSWSACGPRSRTQNMIASIVVRGVGREGFSVGRRCRICASTLRHAWQNPGVRHGSEPHTSHGNCTVAIAAAVMALSRIADLARSAIEARRLCGGHPHRLTGSMSCPHCFEAALSVRPLLPRDGGQVFHPSTQILCEDERLAAAFAGSQRTLANCRINRSASGASRRTSLSDCVNKRRVHDSSPSSAGMVRRPCACARDSE